MSIRNTASQADGKKLRRVAFLPRELQRRFKAQAAHEDCTVSDLLARVVETYLESRQAKAARSEA